MKRTLLFTVIASVLTTGAYATSSTVTSKDYVDAQDALKQNTIPATGTNSETPGDTVVTYTSTAGTIGERGICDADAEENDDCDNDNLVTRDFVADAFDEALNGGPGTVPIYDGNGYLGNESRGIYDGSNGYNSSTDADKLVTAAVVYGQMNNIQSERVVKTVCVDSPDCTLWQMQDVAVHKLECSVAADCINKKCSSGSGGMVMLLRDCNACVDYKCVYREGGVE